MQLVVMGAAFLMFLFVTGLFLAVHYHLYFTKETVLLMLFGKKKKENANYFLGRRYKVYFYSVLAENQALS